MGRPRAIHFEKGSDTPNSNLPVLLFAVSLLRGQPAKEPGPATIQEEWLDGSMDRYDL